MRVYRRSGEIQIHASVEHHVMSDGPTQNQLKFATESGQAGLVAMRG
ncbi:hypothetical protein EDC35_10663 [Thiobaca trueperi]|uniref:Uncharacterized protein n=1 Tax=Thiobaca trueperi TaxID=127458 RepID=A0A4R3MX66_9GAMM|nr:hypothetical protein EDC35_10663 [Thiobaca trueperi]